MTDSTPTSGEQTNEGVAAATSIPTTPSAAPEQPAQAAPEHAAAPPAEPVPDISSLPSTDVAAPKLTAQQKMRARKVRTEEVDLGDALFVRVQGYNVSDAIDLYDDFEDAEEGDEKAQKKAQTRLMLRSTTFDIETGKVFFDDSWSDDEIDDLPMDVANQLLAAANKVLGRTAEPGKD